MSGVLLSCLIGFYQYFFDPTVFGLSVFKASNEETWGTSTFRLVGLLGSPQHNAFVFSLGLALMTYIYSNKKDIIKFVIIATSGVLTLSTFFGGSLLCAFVKYVRMIAAFALVLIVSLSIDFFTKLEGFLFKKLGYYIVWLINISDWFGGFFIWVGDWSRFTGVRSIINFENFRVWSSLIIIFYERKYLVFTINYILFHFKLTQSWSTLCQLLSWQAVFGSSINLT